jgi:hypothetical protein
MCNTQWARDELYKGTEMTTCQPNTVKASCSLLAIGNAKLLGMGVTKERDDNLPAKYSQGFLQLLAMGNTQLARHERHER